MLVEHVGNGFGVTRFSQYGKVFVEKFDGTAGFVCTENLRQVKLPTEKIIALDWDGIMQDIDSAISDGYPIFLQEHGVDISSQEELLDYLRHTPKLDPEFLNSSYWAEQYLNSPVVTEAKELISELHEAGYSVVIITSRRPDEYWLRLPCTTAYLDGVDWIKHILSMSNVQVDAIFYSIREKGKLCEHIKPIVFIDDYYKNVIDVAKRCPGTKAILKKSMLSPSEAPEGVKYHTISSLKELRKLIPELNHGITVNKRLPLNATELRMHAPDFSALEIQLGASDVRDLGLSLYILRGLPSTILRKIKILYTPKMRICSFAQIPAFINSLEAALAIAGYLHEVTGNTITIAVAMSFGPMHYQLAAYEHCAGIMQQIMSRVSGVQIVLNDEVLAGKLRSNFMPVHYCKFY